MLGSADVCPARGCWSASAAAAPQFFWICRLNLYRPATTTRRRHYAIVAPLPNDTTTPLASYIPTDTRTSPRPSQPCLPSPRSPRFDRPSDTTPCRLGALTGTTGAHRQAHRRLPRRHPLVRLSRVRASIAPTLTLMQWLPAPDPLPRYAAARRPPPAALARDPRPSSSACRHR